MADYYQLLGIRKDASLTEIRSAYKRLAMLYHPDRNPGNPEAEELFKRINEAYHVLADAEKKARYDGHLTYPQQTYHSSAHDTSAYWRDYHRQRYEQWRQTQQHTYQFDKRYFRIQAMAIGVFLLIAGFCFALVNIIEYVQNEHREQQYQENLALIKQVNVLFISGKQEEAIQQIRTLQQEAPLEYAFHFAEDSLLLSLRHLADKEFKELKFKEACAHYQLLQRFEEPARAQTLQRIAECEYFLGEFASSVKILQQLLSQQPGNIDLIYRIAVIYQDDIKEYEQALHYLSLGRKNFKTYMTNIYGEAFELLMDTRYVHEHYVDIFNRRALVNLHLKRYADAEKDCNWAVLLRPQAPHSYYQRALAALHLTDQQRVCDDLRKATSLGHAEARKLLGTRCGR